jgi:hypothetical protein
MILGFGRYILFKHVRFSLSEDFTQVILASYIIYFL